MRIAVIRVHRGLAPLRPITRRPRGLWTMLAGQVPVDFPSDAPHVVNIAPLGHLVPVEILIAWGKPSQQE